MYFNIFLRRLLETQTIPSAYEFQKILPSTAIQWLFSRLWSFFSHWFKSVLSQRPRGPLHRSSEPSLSVCADSSSANCSSLAFLTFKIALLSGPGSVWILPVYTATCIIHLKCANRVDLKCYHHRKKKCYYVR